jgi:N4-gp56 family major capsid protein
MASLLPNATQYATLVSADADFRAVLWSRIFSQTFKYRSRWRHFTGPEESGMPIVKKTDLSAGVAQDVVFNMVSPIGGQGVNGATQLRTVTRAINEHSFRVRVDANRQGIAYNQLINWLRKDLNPEQKAVELLSDWAVRKYDDDIMTVLCRYGTTSDPGNNLIRAGNRATQALLKSTDYVSPSVIEQAKAKLMGIGATPLATDLVESGSVCPQFLFYSPDAFLRPLRTNSTFLNTLQYGDVRGKDNALFTGHYPMWDNNVLYADETATSDVDGRQGTPLMPMAFLGTALTDGSTTTLTGGGVSDPAGTGDYFAFFPGYPWYITSTDTIPTDTATHYALIYNNSGASINSYEIVSYLATGFEATGKSLVVTRLGSSDGAGNARANTASRYTTSHPSGSVIIPCTSQGVPLMYAIHAGSDALRYAIGNVENQRAEQLDDFGMDQGIATNTVRGMSVFTDRRNIAKNFVIVEGTGVHPLLAAQPETYTY